MENNNQTKHLYFTDFKKNYEAALHNFMDEKDSPEKYLLQGYQLGREAVVNKMQLINVAAIHHDVVNKLLKSIESNAHLEIADKANLFFIEVASPYHIASEEYQDAIALLNELNIENALRINHLNDLLKQRERLIKEVYHRVKNNLQVISSLLALQVETIDSPEAKKALTESSTRVRSMSLVHEMLYKTIDLEKIDINEYINNLFNYLCGMYGISKADIQFELNCDNLFFTIDKAIPLGLILNELISNSFKYAFPDDRKKIITCEIKKQNDETIFIYADNGIGLPKDLDIENTKTLGLQLVTALSKQLKSYLTVDRDNGTKFTFIIHEKMD